MSKDIKFIDTIGLSKEYHPIPAKDMIPDWYKKTLSHVDGIKRPFPFGENTTSGTIKKCMPVFDALTSGYLLLSYSDVVVERRNGASYFSWSGEKMIGFHASSQAPIHPVVTPRPEANIPKWRNSWGIKTPKGYSCFFINPVHRESPFTTLEGIVDTDTYNGKVELPFTLKDPFWEGTIPAGTPIAQVIPFKRESYRMTVSSDQKDIDELIHQNRRLLSVFYNGYKDKFWSRKEYS